MLRENSAIADVRLGHVLKEICLEGWSSNPARALGAAAALKALFKLNPEREIGALMAWTSGLEDLIHGRMESAIERLDVSQSGFMELNKKGLAAATQVSKLVAPSNVAVTTKAIDCGLRSRSV